MQIATLTRITVIAPMKADFRFIVLSLQLIRMFRFLPLSGRRLGQMYPT